MPSFHKVKRDFKMENKTVCVYTELIEDMCSELLLQHNLYPFALCKISIKYSVKTVGEVIFYRILDKT